MTDEELAEIFKAAWHEADEEGLEGSRSLAGVRAVRAALPKVEIHYHRWYAVVTTTTNGELDQTIISAGQGDGIEVFDSLRSYEASF